MSARFERVALIGLGLIAGSMAHAMRAGGLAGRITGHARSAETRATAAEIGLVDEVVVVDDHITGVVSEHQAGKVLGWPDTGIRIKGRRSTPGR